MSGPTATRTGPWLALVLFVMLLAGCAANPAQQDVYDPLEPMNRKVFWFNDQFDQYLLQPVSQAWEFITPAFVREGVGNFFGNMTYPGVVLNDILQAKNLDAGRDLLRFIVNTTIGIGGLFDPATLMGLPDHREDFGQTLAVWGSGAGPYLVLPLLGPSNFRDAAGLPGDLYTNVLTFVPLSTPELAGLSGLHMVNTRAQLAKAVRISREAAVDRYAFIRSAYQQQRLNAIYDGNPPIEDIYDENLFEENPPPANKHPGGASKQPPATGQ
ncbi:MAG TPA: VacJ family lipoprotein [Nitrococcus sp.]|nr:VacJ family lipoprotein [Nitrococcus sp.]